MRDFELVSHAGETVQAVRDSGFLAIVVTNQPELASGELALETLNAMHRQLLERVPLTAIYVCAHRATDGCGCHKPKPGLLERARDEWAVDLTASFLIGDRWRDVEAGKTAGCTTVLIEHPYSGACRPDHVVQDLSEAVTWVLRRRA
jgi:D-glycero-D-manno-heptose 1,7-bisphosphate phosphatase